MNNEFQYSDFTAEEVAEMCKNYMERDVRTVIKTLDFYELEQVSECEDIPYPLRNLAEWLWCKRVEDPEPVEKNLPVSELLEYFRNKHSKKVQMARKQLQSRFEYLSFDEQLAVLNCMMKEGTFNDTVFCADYLLKDRFWTTDRDTIINYQINITLQFITAMEKRLSGTYKLSKLVAKRLPKEFILNCYKTLKHDEVFPEQKTIIRNFVMRLAEDKNFKIDKTVLSASDYAYICYRTGRQITDKEAEDALYMNIVDKLNNNPYHYVPLDRDRWYNLEFQLYDEGLMKAISGHKKVLVDYMKWKTELYKKIDKSGLDEDGIEKGNFLITALPKKYKKLITK